MPNDSLGTFEHLVLLALLQLGGSGYSAPLVLELESRGGRAVSAAKVYIALRRLEARRLVASRMEDPTEREVGKRRRVFSITPLAVAKLRESQQVLARFHQGLEPILGSDS